MRKETLHVLRAVSDGVAIQADSDVVGRANRLLCVYARAILDRPLPTMPFVLGDKDL